MTLREKIEDLVAETEHMLRGPVRYPRRQLGVLSDKLRAALRSTAPSESGERALGWRQGVLDAAEFLRHAWDDGEQGNHNDAAELVLLRHYAERGPSPGDANKGEG